MRPSSFVVRGAFALVLLLALALGALWWRMDALAERAIERGGSEALGVRTELRSLLLRPFSGRLSLRGLEIANPPGYAGSFLVVDEAEGRLDVATLRREVIEVEEVTLHGVTLTLEETGTGSNYDAILANLDRGESTGAPSEGPAVRIRDLYVRDVTAQLRVASSPPLTLQVPEIHLRDLGGPGGAGSGEITAEVVRAVLATVATRAPGVPLALAARLLTGLGLSGASQILRETGERGLDAAREALRDLLDRR
jgi:hypothetical protein